MTKRLDRNVRRDIGCVSRVRNVGINGLLLDRRSTSRSPFSGHLRGCLGDKKLTSSTF